MAKRAKAKRSAAPAKPAKPAKIEGWGGRRANSGRKPKGYVAPTAIAGLDLKSALALPPPQDIEGVAQKHARSAIDALVKQLLVGSSEAAKVSAANAILDRGYGRPSVEAGGDPMLPFLGVVSTSKSIATEIREEARKSALLAIEVLHRIKDAGASETARVQAAKSLLDRGLGTVAPAKMPDEFGQRTLGKKEEAAEAAKAAASGRYVTPPAPPRSSMQ
jgi:hypothetical protein